MQHADQHNEAIKASLRVNKHVSCDIHDDKVRDAGQMKIENGVITIQIRSPIHLMTQEASRDFLVDAVSLALRQCYDAMPEAFEPTY